MISDEDTAEEHSTMKEAPEESISTARICGIVHKGHMEHTEKPSKSADWRSTDGGQTGEAQTDWRQGWVADKSDSSSVREKEKKKGGGGGGGHTPRRTDSFVVEQGRRNRGRAHKQASGENDGLTVAELSVYWEHRWNSSPPTDVET